MPSKVATDSAHAVSAGEPALRSEAVSPTLGIIPRSRLGRFFLAWAALNVVLTLLPVFTILGNGTQMVAGLLPWTVLYSYAVFTLNCVFGVAFYLLRAKPWSDGEDRAA